MHRTVVINDGDIVTKRDDHKKVSRKRKVPQRGRHARSRWGKATLSVLSSGNNQRLCEHPGTCKPGHGCDWYDAETYCDRNCGCPPDCESSVSFLFTSCRVELLEGCNRRVGCRCHVDNAESEYICDDGECPCIVSGQECDPELCIPCDAR
jgi:hypothetical protein